MKYLSPSIVLFLVAFLAYGLLMPQMGFYWDDLPITWIRYQMGSEALTDYFSTNRPVWGLVHQVSTSLLPQEPIYWQVFALIWRWLGAVIAYAIFGKLLPDQPRAALGLALLFLLYPGFDQHWAAYLYSHFYIVLFFFLLSLLFNLLAAENPSHYWHWTAAGLLFSALNLWMMEYFYVLELARVGLILMAVRSEKLTMRERLLRALKLWLPYLAVFGLAVLSRLFVFNNQIYGIGLTDQLKSAPGETLRGLAQTILLSLRLVLKGAWMQVLEMPDAGAAVYTFVVMGVILLAGLGFWLSPDVPLQSMRKSTLDALWLIGIGALAVFLAGWPFWLVGFPMSLTWPASRFTLSFALGAALIFGGLIGLIPWERVRLALVLALVGLAAGRQYLNALEYQQDWARQRDLFWQMTWRVPGLQPNTVVLMNEGGLNYYADNSLGAALNWIYASDNHSRQVEYVLFYPTTRLGNALPSLEPGQPVEYDYLAGQFHGNTSQVLAMYYEPPGCLRILDDDIEGANRTIREPSLMRYSARLSSLSLILNEPRARLPKAYVPEPEHGFCYYFEKADLARQFKDWDTVVELSATALTLEHPFIPAEQFVFIEGFAHVGAWEQAVDYSERAFQASPELVERALCRLWKRIGAETASSEERSEALAEVQSMFACNL